MATATSPGLTSVRPEEFTLGERIALRIIPRLLWAFLCIVGITWRFEEISENPDLPHPFDINDKNVVYCFWHQSILPSAHFFKDSGILALISPSFDGELIARTFKLFGIDAVRGSSSNKFNRALPAFKRRMFETGRPAIFTVDGPRGPIHQSKMGPVKLAQIIGAPLRCFHLQPERAFLCDSWDHFLIPMPFTRIVASWACDINVPANLTKDEMELWRQQVDEAIERARLRSLDHFGLPHTDNPGHLY